jgi:hypothetical protein
MMEFNILILCFSLFTSTISLACPLCTTITGTAVRLAIFDQHFLFNTFRIFLPFSIFIFIALMIYYMPLTGESFEKNAT